MDIVVVGLVITVVPFELQMPYSDERYRLRQRFDLEPDGIIDHFLGIAETRDFRGLKAFHVNGHRHGAGNGIPKLATDGEGEHIFIGIIEHAEIAFYPDAEGQRVFL